MQVQVLQALTLQGIKTIILRTKLEGTNVTIAEALKLVDSPNLELFCEKILDLTGGVSLLVLRALEACVRAKLPDGWGQLRAATLELLLREHYLPDLGKSCLPNIRCHAVW